ncbi:MAG: amidohydrolase [Bacteroidota bacterium]
MANKTLKVIGLQLDLIWQNPEANRKHIDALLNGYQEHADIIVLPEMFTTGFTMDAASNFEELQGPTLFWMKQLAERRDALICGSVIIREDGEFFNRFLMVSPDGLIGEYNKRHLFRMADEHHHYLSGEEWVRAEYKGWRILPQVCYDLRFPVFSRNRLDAEGNLSYDLLIYVANWPTPRVNHWETLLQARAIENQAFVVGVNRVGVDGVNVPYSGSSMILDPKGKRLAFETEKEAILEATLDPEPMNAYREKFPIWKDADVFELYM